MLKSFTKILNTLEDLFLGLSFHQVGNTEKKQKKIILPQELQYQST